MRSRSAPRTRVGSAREARGGGEFRGSPAEGGTGTSPWIDAIMDSIKEFLGKGK